MENYIYGVIVLLIMIVIHFLHVRKNGGSQDEYNTIILSGIISAVILAVVIGVTYFSQVSDREVRNGKVIGKSKEAVTCSHTYPCNCNKNGCSTCFQHLHDYDWVVKTNIPYNFTIDRVDSQGVFMPDRWAKVKVGDAVSDSFTYVNYIKGANHSLFNKQIGDADMKDIPVYPGTTYDYYHVNRVVGVGVDVDPKWNHQLQDLLSDLGPSYQINAVFVLTNKDDNFDSALEYNWNGGKKNDVIVVIHMDKESKKISSTHVISWTPNQLFKVELRDNIVASDVFEIDRVLEIFTTQVKKNWVRMKMDDYKYLNSDIDISITAFIIAFILSMVGYIGAYMYINHRKGVRMTFKNRVSSNPLHSRVRRKFF